MNLAQLTVQARIELETLIPNLDLFKFKDIATYEHATWYVFQFRSGSYTGQFSYTITEGKINSVTI